MTETADTGDGKQIQSVRKAYTIIEYLEEHNEARITDISEDLGLHPSTTTVHLQTLSNLGLLQPSEQGTYQLSYRFLEIGGKCRKNNSRIYQAVRPKVDQLSQEKNEVASIGVEENGQRVLLYRTEPVEGITDNAPVGQFMDMHMTSVGKALLSTMSDEQIRAIVDTHGLAQATENTITDLDVLLDEIETVREEGYAIEDEEHITGVRAVAVPLDNLEDIDNPAAISLAGPKHRFEHDRIEGELVEALLKYKNIISLEYEHYS
ncbi:MAG: IclR family transcriptional regulator [Halorhabdus sp.]